jgi:hypothetical protein
MLTTSHMLAVWLHLQQRLLTGPLLRLGSALCRHVLS